VFGNLAGKNVLVVGAGKMSSLAAKHLYSNGAQKIVVTNRSPEKAEALADEIEATARPWAELEQLLVEADVVISSTGSREPVLTKPMFKKIAKARRYRPMMVIDIAVPRDAEPAIADVDGVYLFDIDDLDKVVAANLAERGKAAGQATKIVEHEAGQFEQWVRTQAVVPTIRALREHFGEIADAEVQKTLDAFARRDHTPAEQRETIKRVVQLVVNKLLHAPTMALRESPADEAEARAAVLCALFALEPDAAPRPSQSPLAESESSQEGKPVHE